MLQTVYAQWSKLQANAQHCVIMRGIVVRHGVSQYFSVEVYAWLLGHLSRSLHTPIVPQPLSTETRHVIDLPVVERLALLDAMSLAQA
jgi:hypothetical protein